MKKKDILDEIVKNVMSFADSVGTILKIVHRKSDVNDKNI